MNLNKLHATAVFALSLSLISCGEDKEKTQNSVTHTETSKTTTVTPTEENPTSNSVKTEETTTSIQKEESSEAPVTAPIEEPVTDMPATDAPATSSSTPAQ